MSSSFRGSAQKSFSAQAWDGITVFFLKTVIPLIPVAGIFYLVCMIINAEITGTYRGVTPATGAITMEINEDNEALKGTVIFKRDIRYEIVDGKMLDESKMKLKLVQKFGPGENEKRVITFEGEKDQNILNGVLHDGPANIQVRLVRSSTSAFVGKRWLTRALNYFGAGIKQEPTIKTIP